MRADATRPLTAVAPVSEAPLLPLSEYDAAGNMAAPPEQTPKLEQVRDHAVQSDHPVLTRSFAVKVMNTPALRAHMEGYTLENLPVSRTYSPEAQGLAWEASALGRSVHCMVEGDSAPTLPY